MAEPTPLAERLERHVATADSAYRESYFELLLGLARLHDAVDSALADDVPESLTRLEAGLARLLAANERLSMLGDGLVHVRTSLFECGQADLSEPLLAREPFFAALDYDALHRELAEQRAALPHRAFWDAVATRMRAEGARGGFRLLERQARELQTDLRQLISDVEAIGRLRGRALGVALHDVGIPTARVTIGYTRLVTTFGYVSFICERAMSAYERAAAPLAAAG